MRTIGTRYLSQKRAVTPAKNVIKTENHLTSDAENAELKAVLAEILESTWVVKSPCYYKVLVDARVIDDAKRLVGDPK